MKSDEGRSAQLRQAEALKKVRYEKRPMQSRYSQAFIRESMLLYVVTDRSWSGKMSLYQQVEAALQNGVSCVQLREKALPRDAFLREARKFSALCRRYQVPFIINDDVELAIECGADGVHVGQEDMDAAMVRKRVGDMILGVSVHTVDEAVRAVQAGADYLGLGAVFATTTKQDAEVMPRETLSAICAAVEIPTVAIGGITAGNVGELAGCGVDGIAVVSAIFAAVEPGAAAAELHSLARKMIERSR